RKTSTDCTDITDVRRRFSSVKSVSLVDSNRCTMSLSEAIITYHDLLTDEVAVESDEKLNEQMRTRGLFFGERPLCSVLRPRFLTPEQYTYMRQAIRPLLRAFEKISHQAVADADFRAQF